MDGKNWTRVRPSKKNGRKKLDGRIGQKQKLDEKIGHHLWAPPRAARQAGWAKRAATSLAEAGRWGLVGGAFIYVKAQGRRLAQIYTAGAHQGKSTNLAAEGGPC